MMSQNQAPRLTAVALVLAASTYTLVMCALFTAGAPVSNGLVAAADAGIVLAALCLVALTRPDSLALPMLALAANFLVIALVREGVDLKSLRDIMLIVAFLSLGRMFGDFRAARLAFFAVAGFVVVFAVLEFLFPRVFVGIFNVLQFYVMRGEVTTQAAGYVDNSLFVSGTRNAGRALIPGLGEHRVSSIFLEPVSMGNFGAIAVAFALSAHARHWRTALAAAVVGALAIVLADARFAAIAALVFIAGRMVPMRWRTIVLAPAPIAAVGLLMLFGAVYPAVGDDLPSRLAISGVSLSDLDLGALFGLTPGLRITLDSGYAYVITAVGLPFALLLWIAYVLLPTPGSQSSTFKFLIGLYVCALLCVSGSSLFALKTGGLLWFLLGALMAEEGAGLRSRTASAAAPAYPAPSWPAGVRFRSSRPGEVA